MENKLAAKRSAAVIQNVFSGTAPIQSQQNWKELEDMYQECAKAICTTLSSVQPLVNNTIVQENLVSPTEFKVAVDGLVRDCDGFANDLIKIHQLHSHRSGNIQNNDELAESFQIYGLYSEFFDKFKALTFQTVIEITDKTQEAIAIAARRQAEQEAAATPAVQEPSVTQETPNEQ